MLKIIKEEDTTTFLVNSLRQQFLCMHMESCLPCLCLHSRSLNNSLAMSGRNTENIEQILNNSLIILNQFKWLIDSYVLVSKINSKFLSFWFFSCARERERERE